MLIYHFLWTLIGGPLFLGCQFYKNPRLRERLAFKFPTLSLKSGSIWVHALSVGEVKSALPLVSRIVQEYPERDLVFSSTTVQGLELARKELGRKTSAVVCMPLDFWWSSRRVIRWLRPDLYVVVETDLWPGLLHCLKSTGAASILVNGRVSESTFRSYSRAPYLARQLFADLRYCLMQSYQDRERLVRIGVPSEKVIDTGNIKFDHTYSAIDSEEKAAWIDRFGLSPQALIWVAGSTHGKESELILDVFVRLRSSYPKLALILAPRKIEESALIVRLARQKGLTCIRRSEASGNVKDPQVIVLDTIGELSRTYGLGHISFVGGSLVAFGGHNLLEPASFGLPVLFGPHTQNFAWMAEALEKANGGLRVRDGNELFSLMSRLICEPEMRAQIGEAARAFVVKNRGALDRAMAYIATCLKKERTVA